MRHLLTDLRGNPIYTSFGSWRGNQAQQTNAAGTNSPHHNPRSLLFLYVTSSAWNDAVRRAQSHPQEVLYVDDNGNTPLHRALQLDPPVEVVTALKDAVTHTNFLGQTPLHIASSHRCNARTLRELIELYPGALCQLSKMGRTPIHYACMSYRGLDLVAFQVLLEKTLEESRRNYHQQQHDQEGTDNDMMTSCGGGEELKITDFIDILREAKEGDTIDDDEDISVLLGDGDSQNAVGFGSSSSMMFQSRSNDASAAMEDDIGEQDEESDENTPEKNNFNVVTWKDSTGNTPLGLLFRRYRERVRSVITVLEQMRNSTTATPVTTSPTSLQTDLGHLWGKARLIVARLTEEHQQQEHEQHLAVSEGSRQREDDASSVGQHWAAAAAWSKERFATNKGGLVPHTHAEASKVAAAVVKNDEQNDDDSDDGTRGVPEEVRQFRIVHASVGLTGYGCPPEMIRLAISIHPHQVREMDEDGNLPIHIAATASSFGTLASNLAMTDEESSVFSDSMASFFSNGSSNRNNGGGEKSGSFDTVIKLLLKQYPQAAQTPHGRTGRLPLVLAARAGHRTWNDGMKTLLRAYPPALFSGSKGMIPVKLYPYALALIGGGSTVPSSEVGASLINSASNHSCGSSILSTSAHSCGSGRFKGRGGNGLLHNLLLSKQRQIRELMGTGNSTHPSAHIGGRQRNHLPSLPPLSITGNGSSHSSVTQSNHRSRTRNSSMSSKKKTAVQPGKKQKAKVDPKLATTMFELLRTKPDLVEAGRSYQEELERARRKGNMKTDFATGNFSSITAAGQQTRSQSPWLRRKKTMSPKLLERMTAFQRKAWK